MFNTFFGFSGRLRRRDFILWSILVPIVLILPLVIGVASNAASPQTTLAQDLVAAGLMETFIGLVCVMNFISVALFWKRINDVDDETRRKRGGEIMRWGYAVLTVLNTALVCVSFAVNGDAEGASAGFVLLAFWTVACWLKPHFGENASGPDPRQGSRARVYEEQSLSNPNLDAALERALAERNARASAVLSPKLARAAASAPTPTGAKPSFGKRG